MPGVFDSKIFNADVFAGYVGRIPNTKRNALIKSRAIRPRPDLAAAMKDQNGGNVITTAMTGLISGSKPLNYDGQTDMTASKTKTFNQSRVVVGRWNAWTEADFSYDITGGEDFLENIAAQISEYWDEIDQGTIVSILKGVFKMADTEGQKFVASHTHDVTKVANSEGKMGYMDGTTLNTAMQHACGDNKASFSLVCMHSVVATNLENLKLLVYAKFNDAEGIEREVALGTLNGRPVLVDDSMPTETSLEKATVYTTFVLGAGAIEYTDCGARVPYEVDRDPKTNGGEDTLYSRQRKCFAPKGISWTNAHMASKSPTDVELENGGNWKLVSTAEGDEEAYIDLKSIPIARILSLG